MGPLPDEPPLPSPGRLLWITDLDDIPLALRLAIQYAVRIGAHLKLLHAILGDGNYAPDEESRLHAVKLLEKAAVKARSMGVECDWQLETASLVASLRTVTETWSPDRILRVRCIGTKHEGLDLGTEIILRETVVPVLVVGSAQPPALFRQPTRILFPTSLDRRSLEVASEVLRFAHTHGAEITMLHVIDDYAGRNSWTERVRACAAARFDEVREESGGLPIQTIIELGNLPETVARIARTQHYSIILLSVFSGISFRGDFRPGSAYKILCHAPCPVLVCKQGISALMYGLERVGQSLVGPLHLPPA